MPARSIKVWNSTSSEWEDVAVASPDTSSFVSNALFTAPRQLLSSTASGTPAVIAIEDDQIILSNQVFG